MGKKKRERKEREKKIRFTVVSRRKSSKRVNLFRRKRVREKWSERKKEKKNERKRRKLWWLQIHRSNNHNPRIRSEITCVRNTEKEREKEKKERKRKSETVIKMTHKMIQLHKIWYKPNYHNRYFRYLVSHFTVCLRCFFFLSLSHEQKNRTIITVWEQLGVRGEMKEKRKKEEKEGHTDWNWCKMSLLVNQKFLKGKKRKREGGREERESGNRNQLLLRDSWHCHFSFTVWCWWRLNNWEKTVNFSKRVSGWRREIERDTKRVDGERECMNESSCSESFEWNVNIIFIITFILVNHHHPTRFKSWGKREWRRGKKYSR